MKTKEQLRQQYKITDEVLKNYFLWWRKMGKNQANFHFNNVMWYLWELKCDSKFRKFSSYLFLKKVGKL